jgi:hypothetical protein
MQMLGGRSGMGKPPAAERGTEDTNRRTAPAAPAEDFDDDIPF